MEGNNNNNAVVVNCTEIQKHTTEYDNVLYKLHLATRRSDSVADLSVWDIKNPHVAVKFDRASQDKLILDCFIDEETWGKQNTLESIQKFGVQFPKDGSGMNFVHGALPSGKIDRPNGPCTLVCVSVAVGRTAIVPTMVPEVGEIEDNHPTNNTNTEGNSVNSFPTVDETKYDSVYHTIPKTEEDEVSDEVYSDGGKYTWSYYIKDSDKVFPKYLIRFNYEGSDITDSKIQICEMCEEKQAVLYCSADDAKLCESCDTEMHSANKVVARHKRVPLKDFKKKKRRLSIMQRRMGDTLQIFNSKCPLHPHVDVEFYCQACEIPVCVHCKMVGSHSSGEMGSHKLIGIGSAWQQAVDIANVPDKILDSRKKHIQNHLSSLSEKLEAVNENATEQDQHVRRIARVALTQIAREAQQKRDHIRAAELELYRQLQEIHWSEHFLDLQRQALLPVEFLSTWKRHKRIRETLYSYNDASPLVLNEVHPDIVVDTKSVQVLSNDSLVLNNNKDEMEEDDDDDNNNNENDGTNVEDIEKSGINIKSKCNDNDFENDEAGRLSIAPLTNRFATLSKEFGRRPLSKIQEDYNIGSVSSNSKGNEENDACNAVNQLWMQTLGKTVKKQQQPMQQ